MPLQLFSNKFSLGTLFRSPSGRSFAGLATATLAGQITVILVSPIVANLSGPARYGEAMTILSMAGIIAVFSCLRYEAAIPLCKEDHDALQMVWLCILITFTSGVLLAVGIFLFLWSSIFEYSTETTKLIWFLPALVIIQGLYAALDGWALFHGNIRLLSACKILQGVSLSICQVGFGYFSGGSAASLIIAFVVSQTAGSILIGYNLLRMRKAGIIFPMPSKIWSLAHKYRKFPALELWARACTNATDLLPQVFVAFFFGPVAAGHFGLAQRILGVPLRLVSVSSSQIYISEIVRCRRGDPRLTKIFVDTVARSGILAMMYLLPIWALSSYIFGLLFGKPWMEAGYLSQILCVLYLVLVPSRSVRYTVQYADRQEVGLVLSSLSLVISLAPFIFSGNWGLSLVEVTAAYAGFGVVSNLWWMIVGFRLLKI